MLALTPAVLAAALAEVGRTGASHIEGAVTAGAQRRVLAAEEGLPFCPAPVQVGRVRQQVDVFSIERPGPDCGSCLTPLLALAEEYVALLRRLAVDLHDHGLASFQPTRIDVQRYRAGSLGITPHRDGRRFVKLVSVFSLGAPARFRLCVDRQGTPLREFDVTAGDLVLVRAPGFAGDGAPGPLHSVSGPRGGVRYSIGLRMERRPEHSTSS